MMTMLVKGEKNIQGTLFWRKAQSLFFKCYLDVSDHYRVYLSPFKKFFVRYHAYFHPKGEKERETWTDRQIET